MFVVVDDTVVVELYGIKGELTLVEVVVDSTLSLVFELPLVFKEVDFNMFIERIISVNTARLIDG